MGDLNPDLIHGPLGPAKSSAQTASRSVQPFLQGSLVWQTDHATRSLTMDRIYVRSTTMRSKKYWIFFAVEFEYGHVGYRRAERVVWILALWGWLFMSVYSWRRLLCCDRWHLRNCWGDDDWWPVIHFDSIFIAIETAAAAAGQDNSQLWRCAIYRCGKIGRCFSWPFFRFAWRKSNDPIGSARC